MEKSKFLNKIKELKGIICVCEFGSYGTEAWIKGRSDIDLAIVTAPNKDFMYTINIEDKILDYAREFYQYNNIHLTFIMFKDFASKYAKIAVDSDNQFIIDNESWFDFQHYVLKHTRNNEKLDRMLKIDEQYSYFGGIIDESLL